jgi:lipopolysaccharide export system protein LptA
MRPNISRQITHVTIQSLLALLLCGSSISHSLPSDKEQPINVQSDRASQTILENGAKTEYFGDVLITQGSLKIKGEHVIIHSQDHKVSKIVALGKPAYFEQQPEQDKPLVKAKANKLKYQVVSDIIVLTEQASIEQDGSIVSGNAIEYNINQERVMASSSKDDSTRVIMVLTPEKANISSTKEPSDSPPANPTASENTPGVNTGSAE